MIIKIKKRFLISLSLLLVLFLLLIISPISSTPYTGHVNGSFGIELWISNRNPIIKLNNVTADFQVDPVAGGITAILISFNVTDADGVSQINASKAVVNLTLGYDDGQWRSNSSKGDETSEFGTCKNHTEEAATPDVMIINCTVLMHYYDNTSSKWNINVSIRDIDNGVGINGSTFNFQYNEVSALSLPHKWINFSNTNVAATNVRAYPHVILNNTGNDDFYQINLTAAALIGQTTATESIAATSFGVNLTNSSDNLYLTFPGTEAFNLKDPTTGNATLVHGHTAALSAYNDNEISAKGNVSLFFWVNVPSGISPQKYNNTWNITVIATP